MDKKLINNITFGLIFAGLTGLMALMFFRYLGMVLIVGIYCVLVYPIYKWLLPKLRNMRWLTTIVIIVATIFFILLPTVLIITNLVIEVTNYVSSLNIAINPDSLELGIDSANDILVKANLIDYQISSAEVTEAIKGLVSSSWQNVLNALNTFISIALSSIYYLLFFFIFVAVMLPNWEKITVLIKKVIPLEEDIKYLFFRRSKIMTVDVIKGTALTGVIQGITSWIFFSLLGIPNAFMWSFTIMLLAFVPIVGAALVTIPLAIFYFLTGDYLTAIAILCWHIFVISSIDNIVRPIAVSQEAKVNSVIMFFAFVAGVQVFGPMGLFYGPIIVVLFMTTLEIFQEKYLEQTLNFFNSKGNDPTKLQRKVTGAIKTVTTKFKKNQT